MPRALFLFLLLVGAGLGATALVAPGGNAGHGDHVVHLVAQDVEGAPFAFAPATLTVEAGTKVRFVNDEDVFHTVTSTDSQERRRPNGDFGHTLSSKGQSVEITFREAGPVQYYCQPHAGFMFGTVTVTPSSGGSGGDGEGGVPGPGVAGAAAALGLALAGMAMVRRRRA